MNATSVEELLMLARDEGVTLTDSQLEGIAGGDSWADCPDYSSGCPDRASGGDTRDDIDEAYVSEAFRMGIDLGDEVE